MASFTQIFRDAEEALSREARRILFDYNITVTRTILQDVYDPFTGDLIQTPIQPSFYDSSADANNIQYPQFFIKLIKAREDRFTGREVPLYSHQQIHYLSTAPKAYQIVVFGADGNISSPSNSILSSILEINQIVPNYLIRLLNGNNKGTYIVSSVNPGTHSINLSSDIVVGLPTAIFDPNSRTLFFTGPSDLSTVAAGDNFVDSLNNIFPIISTNSTKGSLILGGSSLPSMALGGKVTRVGNILRNSDPSPVSFIIMDPSQPIMDTDLTEENSTQISTQIQALNWPVPIDTYYLLRIDSKERATHIDIINRMWEEFNPPRTGLPIVARTSLSAESLLTADVISGGSQIITVANNSPFNIGDPVFIINDFIPTRNVNGTFEFPFASTVVSIGPNGQLTLANSVPDTFKVADNSKIISNAEFNIWMFHFVDHNTRDVESAQYWVHEFTFWIQLWVERQGLPENINTISRIATPIGDLDNGNIIIDDQ